MILFLGERHGTAVSSIGSHQAGERAMGMERPPSIVDLRGRGQRFLHRAETAVSKKKESVVEQHLTTGVVGVCL